MATSVDVRELLLSEDEEFRLWMQEHHRYEDRLAELAQKPVLTDQEELEEKQLKKKKLLLKDQMAAKVRGYEAAHASA